MTKTRVNTKSRRAVIACVVLLLGACTNLPKSPPGDELSDNQATAFAAIEQREQQLAGYPHWSATGRIAVDDGRDGGSGQFRWRLDERGFELLVRAPLGQGSWRLYQVPGQDAVLEASHLPAPVSGPDAELLVAQQVGWRVPIEPLTWWARALRASGPVARLMVDDQGRPQLIEQQGWQVEYANYATVGALQMPRKLSAEHGDYTVRVVVATWRLEPAGEG